MKKNVAFKCTFNDGGANKKYIGFRGICTDDTIAWNINNNRSWCSNESCECRNYYDQNFNPDYQPEDPCYESRMLIDWKYNAGWTHYGAKGEMPRKIKGAQKGKVAILTTLFPGDSEIDRRVVALFMIGEILEEPGEATSIIAFDDYKIRLAPDEEIYFWDYYSNTNNPDRCAWGTGLFRYVYDINAAQVIKAVKDIKKNSIEKKRIDKFLKVFCRNSEIDNIIEPDGPRTRWE